MTGMMEPEVRDTFLTRPDVLEARQKTAALVEEARVAAQGLHDVTGELIRLIEEFRSE